MMNIIIVPLIFMYILTSSFSVQCGKITETGENVNKGKNKVIADNIHPHKQDEQKGAIKQKIATDQEGCGKGPSLNTPNSDNPSAMFKQIYDSILVPFVEKCKNIHFYHQTTFRMIFVFCGPLQKMKRIIDMFGKEQNPNEEFFLKEITADIFNELNKWKEEHYYLVLNVKGRQDALLTNNQEVGQIGKTEMDLDTAFKKTFGELGHNDATEGCSKTNIGKNNELADKLLKIGTKLKNLVEKNGNVNILNSHQKIKKEMTRYEKDEGKMMNFADGNWKKIDNLLSKHDNNDKKWLLMALRQFVVNLLIYSIHFPPIYPNEKEVIYKFAQSWPLGIGIPNVEEATVAAGPSGVNAETAA